MQIASYKNERYSRDWSLFFDRQMPETELALIYEHKEVEFIIWTRERHDGRTLCWLQTTWLTKEEIKEWIPEAKWIGTTGGHAERGQWLRSEASERQFHRGYYHSRFPKWMETGRSIMVEVCDCCEALRQCLDEEERDDESGCLTEDDMDDGPIGALVRIRPMIYDAMIN